MGRLPTIIAVLTIAGCSTRVETDDRPTFTVDPNQAFRLEFGRGSGLDGLETIKVSQNGGVILHRTKQPEDGKWETATLQLSLDALAEVLKAVESNGLLDLHRAYHDTNRKDGTQWVLWIKQGDREKSVYFNNEFPRAITRFAEQLDAALSAAGLDKVVWQPVPLSETGRHDRELWDSIKR